MRDGLKVGLQGSGELECVGTAAGLLSCDVCVDSLRALRLRRTSSPSLTRRTSRPSRVVRRRRLASDRLTQSPTTTRRRTSRCR